MGFITWWDQSGHHWLSHWSLSARNCSSRDLLVNSNPSFLKSFARASFPCAAADRAAASSSPAPSLSSLAPSRRVAQQREHSHFYREMRSRQTRSAIPISVTHHIRALAQLPSNVVGRHPERKRPNEFGLHTGAIGNRHDYPPPLTSPVTVCMLDTIGGNQNGRNSEALPHLAVAETSTLRLPSRTPGLPARRPSPVRRAQLWTLRQDGPTRPDRRYSV